MKYFFIFVDCIPLFLVPLCIYYWQKYKEPFWGWLAVIQGIILLQHFWRYIKSFIDIDLQTKLLLFRIDSLVSLALLISIIAILYVFRERKVTFKEDKNLKGFHNNDSQGIPVRWFINPDFRNFKDRSKYPYHLQIHMEFREKDSRGFPKGRKLIKELDAIEDQIDKEIKSICDAYFIGKMMRDGFRYLFYYISDDKKIQDQLKGATVPEGYSEIRLDMVAEKDENWKKVDYLSKFRFE